MTKKTLVTLVKISAIKLEQETDELRKRIRDEKETREHYRLQHGILNNINMLLFYIGLNCSKGYTVKELEDMAETINSCKEISNRISYDLFFTPQEFGVRVH